MVSWQRFASRARRWSSSSRARVSCVAALLAMSLALIGVVPASADSGIWRSAGLRDSFLVDSLTVSPADPSLLLAGAFGPGGTGICRSADGGRTWTQVKAWDVNRYITIRLDPKDPSVAYAAVSHQSGDPGRYTARKDPQTACGPDAVYRGGEIEGDAGLYRSSDGGKTWTKQLDRDVGDVAIDPEQPRILMTSGAEKDCGLDCKVHLLRSADGGKTWSRQIEGAFEDIVFHSRDQSVVYGVEVGLGGESGDGARVVGSLDHGLTWRPLVDLHQGDWSLGPGRHRIALHPTNARLVLALDADRILRSVNGGESWSEVGPRSQDEYCYADVVFSASGSAAFVTDCRGLWRSLDGGATWTRVLADSGLVNFTVLASSTPSSEVLAIGTPRDYSQPSRYLFLSRDEGRTFTRVELPSGGFASNPANAYVADLDRSSPPTLFAMTDDGLWAYTFPTRADSLPRSGDPLAEVLPIVGVLAVALSVVGLRLRKRTSTRAW